MSKQDAIERFIINELILGDGRAKLDPNESLFSGGILDSMALMRLVAFLEDHFRVTVEDGELIPGNFETLNRMQAFLEKKTNKNTSAAID